MPLSNTNTPQQCSLKFFIFFSMLEQLFSCKNICSTTTNTKSLAAGQDLISNCHMDFWQHDVRLITRNVPLLWPNFSDLRLSCCVSQLFATTMKHVRQATYEAKRDFWLMILESQVQDGAAYGLSMWWRQRMAMAGHNQRKVLMVSQKTEQSSSKGFTFTSTL